MKRTVAVAGLAVALAAVPLRAASDADTNITIDPDIARASADADRGTDMAVPAHATSHDVTESAQTPYEKALLNYKSGKYEAAHALINQADQEQPGDIRIEMLKVRILGELHDFDGARHVLNSLYDRSDLTPLYAQALTLTAGDLDLRQRHFEPATKEYETYLQTQPNDADAKLRLIYARLGVGDLVSAGKYASELKPLDGATPAYYFARAAVARSTGGADEEQDIEQARTIYGITVANQYLKTYLEVFSDQKPAASAAKGTAAKNSAPSGRAQ